MGIGHPERPARIRSTRENLKMEFESQIAAGRLLWLEKDEHCPLVSQELLFSAGHPYRYQESILAACRRAAAENQCIPFDADTAASPKTEEAVLRAAGAVVKAVELVTSGKISNAFCLVRPPGHHAESERAQGFCFFNSVAVGVCAAQEKYGCERVCVVDFDVHHGNGTQEMLWNNENALYISTHQMPLYPGTGLPSECGVAGNILNIPLGSGTDSTMYREILNSRILPAVEKWQPDLLFISAGFDAHVADPLASIDLHDEDFGFVTRKLMEICPKVVSTLEGGYDLEGLSASVAMHVGALLEGNYDQM